MDGADDHDRSEELAKKTARLNSEQRQEYEQRVSLAIEDRGRITDQYRLDIVNTQLQSLPRSEYGRQINDAERREQERIRSADYRDARVSPPSVAPAKQHSPEPTTPGQDAGKRLPPLEAKNAPSQPRDPKRDYSELQRTHEQVATKQNADQRGSTEPATAMLSKERLHEMAERCADTRKAGNLEPTPSELRERSDLAKMHDASREKLDRAHSPAPNEQQKQERALLDHQQLAERVGIEARMIGQHLRRQSAPGAESFEHDARRAHQTARLVHAQRQNQNPGAIAGPAHDSARVVQQQEQQKQSAAQEAARGGSTVTSEQRANASPDAKQTLDRKDRAEGVRLTGTDGKSQSARHEAAKPDNSRSGGRGR
jgi:hypothetical protein